MKEEKNDNGLDALNECMVQLRKEIAALGPDLKKVAEQRSASNAADRKLSKKTDEQSDNGNGKWASLGHELKKAGNRGEALAEGLGEEIARHPLMSGMAAFGLGFITARLLFRRS